MNKTQLKQLDDFVTEQQKQQGIATGVQAGVYDIGNTAQVPPELLPQLLAQGAKPKLSDTQQDKARSASNLESDLNLFERNLGEAGLRGKVLGFLPSTTGLSPESADFDSQRKSLAYGLASALAEQKGQGVSDKDVKNFMDLLPSRSDTNKEASNKLNNIRQMLSTRTGNKPSKINLPEDSSMFGGLINNAATDAVGLLNGLLNIPSAVGANYQQVQSKNPQKLPSREALVLNFLKNAGLATANEYNDLAGRPLEGGDVAARIGQRAYQKPVSTVLDVLPFLGLLGKSGQAGNLSKAGEVAQAKKVVASSPKQTGIGASIRHNVRGIDVGPSLYGPKTEARVNATLDRLGVKGTPGQQYAQLEPQMAQLGDQIYQNLTSNPKSVGIDRIVKDFDTNLNKEGIYRTGSLKKNIAQKEAHGYIQDVYDSARREQGIDGGAVPSEISTIELFDLKKHINKDYQGVKRKMDSGQSLTDRDKVISVARQTVDDILSREHPQVKEMTLMQSDIFDAIDSLHKKRGQVSKLKLPFGIEIPSPQNTVGGAQDLLGRLLQGKQ